MELTAEQKYALDTLLAWYKNPKRQYITVGGYAGTGKTTLMQFLRKEIPKKKKVAFCAYTGKATHVLRSKLNEDNIANKDDSISTIHSMIYAPSANSKGEIISWILKDDFKADLIVLDEASMVDEQIWKDMLSFKIPIIAIGDHGQLPPIKGAFNLMEKPDLKLEEIHRQAKDNPIISISIDARTHGVIAVGDYGKGIKKISRKDDDAREQINDILERYNDETLVLCGFNTTRRRLNKYLRNQKEFYTDEPVPGDKVLCLKNNHKKGIYNGMSGTIMSIEDIDENFYFATIMSNDNGSYSGNIAKYPFSNKDINPRELKLPKDVDLFDFGYALTVHKAQGSQSKRVILFEERSQYMDEEGWKRWLYTGVTRAEEELYVIG
jgi:exodeoxyribonuclease-5